MAENCTYYGRISMAELIGFSREPIALAGRRFWSPDYAQWFVRSGPVLRIDMGSPHAAWVLAMGRDGTACRVEQLSQLRHARHAMRQGWEGQRINGYGPDHRKRRARPQKLTWYVRVTLEKCANRPLTMAYRYCREISERNLQMGRALSLPCYSTFVRHVREFERSFPVQPRRCRKPVAMPFDSFGEPWPAPKSFRIG